ncbi:trypsin-like serine protease [Mycobacterium paragordonae]|nr:trypsin-like serine protease [Mycobacterium paragordonae]
MLAAAALVVSVSWPATAVADGGRPQANAEQIAAARIRPAVMFLGVEAYGMVKLPDGKTLSFFGEGSNAPFVTTWNCTGFVVNPDGWVATAGHCADPDTAKEQILKRAVSEYQAQYPDAPVSQDPLATLEWLAKNARVEGVVPGTGPQLNLTLIYGTGTKIAEKMPASVVDFKPLGKGDVALLKVDKHNLPSSELTTDSAVSIGTPVLTVGYAEPTARLTGRSLDPTNKSGKVSRKSNVKSSPVYEIDAAVAEGMSGGPTVDLSGKVIGVNSFGPAGEPQPFNFIAPSDTLATMMAAKAVKGTLGPADQAYRRGLSHYYEGRYSDAITDFDLALTLSPDYPGAADLKTSAANLRQQYGDVSVFERSNLLWYIAAGALLVLLVGGWVTLLVVRNRRQRRAETETETETEAAEAAEPVPDDDDSAGTVRSLGLVPPAGPDEPHFCANCGAQHHHTEKFCPNCGKKISLGASA